MADVAELGIKIDSTDADQASAALKKFADAAGLSTKAAKDLEEGARTAGKTLEQTVTALGMNRSAIVLAARAYDEHAAAQEKASGGARKHAQELAGLSRVAASLANEFAGLSSRLGIVGQALASFGPTTVAIAGSLGAVALAAELVSRSVERLGQKALELRSFAMASGLTTDAIQALRAGAEQLGVSAGSVTTFVERLTVNLSQARLSTGPLYEALLKVDVAFANQIKRAEDVQEAIDIIVKAYQAAGAEGNKLLREAGGRGAVQFAPVAQAIAAAGGMEAFIQSQHESITLTQDQVDELAKMRGELNKIESENADLFAKLFSDAVLSSELAFHNNLKAILSTLNDIQQGKGNLTITHDIMGNPIVAPKGVAGPGVVPGPTIPAVPAVPALAPGVPLPTARPGGAISTAELRSYANDLKRVNDAAGESATIQDRLKARIAEINALYAEGKFALEGLGKGEEARNRAIDIAKLDAVNQLEQQRVGLLGATASTEERVRAKTQELSAARAKGAEISATEAQNIIAVTRAQEDGTLAAQSQIDTLKRQVETFGLSSGAAAEYNTVQEKIDENARNRRTTDDAEIARLREKAVAVGKLTEQLELMQAAQQAVSAGLQTFIQSLLDGKSAAESLSAALKSVGSSIIQASTQAASKQLVAGLGASGVGQGIEGALSGVLGGAATGLGGPLAGIAVGIGASLLGSLFSDNNKKAAEELAKAQEEERNAAIEATAALTEANKAMRALTDETKGPFQQSLERGQQQLADYALQNSKAVVAVTKAFLDQAIPFSQFVSMMNTLGGALQDANDALAAFQQQLITDFAAKLTAQLREATGQGFLNQFADLIAQIAKARTDAAALGVDFTDLINQVFAASAQKLVNDLQLTNDQFQVLLQTFPELNGVVQQFVATTQTATRTAQQLAEQTAALDDRWLALNVDSTTLAGALTLFDRQAYRERLAEQQAGGENMVELEAIQAAERLQVIKKFGEQAQQAINSAARQIRDYLTQLTTGAETALSPRARLEEAKRAFGAELALAQQGNLDAQQQITKFAEDLRQAALAFYGSSTGYQSIVDQITTGLEALPALQQTTDPVVQALQGVNTSTDSVSTAVAATTAAVTTGNSSIVDLLTTISNTLNTIASHTGHMYAATGAAEYALAAGGFVGMPLAAGGPMGTDTVPAWLSPGEFVVNARAAAGSAGLLAAINAGGSGFDEMLRVMEELLVRIVDSIEENTQATMSQTSQLNREQRFVSRKSAA